VTVGGRNLDVYVTDMERIEVLPGPQGTLYGASSMAGTVRLITNKPVLDQFQASVNGSWSMTSGGEDSNSLEAMLNVPVIEGKFALRAALYNADGTVVGPGGVTIPVRKAVASNSERTKDDYNTATYSGIRLGAKYIFNEEWDLLVQHTRQTLRTEGVFDYDPEKGDLKVSRFTDDSLDDFFSQTAWTVEGRLGALDVVYTGAFLDREIDAKLDYTGYTNIGKFIAGYQCEYLVGSFYNGVGSDADTTYFWDPTIGGDPGVIECGNPANAVNLENEMTRWTHEFRVSTDFDGPINLQAGLFYEDFEILHRGDLIDINLNSNLDNAAANARGVTNAATQFRNDNTRTEEQVAIFGEVSWSITDSFRVAAGFRYYDLEYGFKGYGGWRYGNRPLFVDDDDPTNDIRPETTGGRDYEVNLDLIEPLKTDDTIFKFTASWAPGDNSLFYATWSEGYRPPGFNRGAAAGAVYDPDANNTNTAGLECGPNIAIEPNDLTGFPGYCLPYIFESDTLENIEFGWKTTLADGRIQFNGSIYSITPHPVQRLHLQHYLGQHPGIAVRFAEHLDLHARR
jgi:outer membrane receptor protein involved in Fe transport